MAYVGLVLGVVAQAMGEAGVEIGVRCVKPWPLWVIMCPLWGGFSWCPR